MEDLSPDLSPLAFWLWKRPVLDAPVEISIIHLTIYVTEEYLVSTILERETRKRGKVGLLVPSSAPVSVR